MDYQREAEAAGRADGISVEDLEGQPQMTDQKAEEMERRYKVVRNMLKSIWGGMKSRCYNEMNPSFKYYGEKGVSVDEKWHDFEGFAEDMEAGYEIGLSLERIDPYGNYEPDNCKWIPKDKQPYNKRSHYLGIRRASINRVPQVYSQDAQGRINKLIDGLKNLKMAGWRLGQLEMQIGLPLNSLSKVLVRKGVFPLSWIDKVEKFLENPSFREIHRENNDFEPVCETEEEAIEEDDEYRQYAMKTAYDFCLARGKDNLVETAEEIYNFLMFRSN